MKYVLLTEKEFELYEKMVNEGKIGKFLTTGAIALGLLGGGQQANAMNYDYMKKNPNSAIQLSEIDGQWFQEAAIRFVELGDSLLNTNSIESVWSVLKRGFYGTFHKFSIKHLQRYVDEFDFRLNDGNVKIPTDERINSVICGCWGKIMPYKTLKII